MNLSVLLSSESSESTKTIANLPTNNDIVNAPALANANSNNASNDSEIEINQLCKTIWSNT